MAAHYFNGDSFTPSNGFRGNAMYGRTSGGVWLPFLVDAGGAQVFSSGGSPAMGVVDFTFSSNTDQHASGDVIAAPEELADCGLGTGRLVKLVHAILYDFSDQAQNVQIVFLSEDGSIGAESAAFGPTDGVAATIVGAHTFTLHTDAVNSNVFFETPNIVMETGVDGSLWAGLVCREGTPTYAADGLAVKLYFERF